MKKELSFSLLKDICNFQDFQIEKTSMWNITKCHGFKILLHAGMPHILRRFLIYINFPKFLFSFRVVKSNFNAFLVLTISFAHWSMICSQSALLLLSLFVIKFFHWFFVMSTIRTFVPKQFRFKVYCIWNVSILFRNMFFVFHLILQTVHKWGCLQKQFLVVVKYCFGTKFRGVTRHYMLYYERIKT